MSDARFREYCALWRRNNGYSDTDPLPGLTLSTATQADRDALGGSNYSGLRYLEERIEDRARDRARTYEETEQDRLAREAEEE